MFQLIVTIASHCPIIGADVREIVRMTALFNELGREDYVMPEGDTINFLEMIGVTR